MSFELNCERCGDLFHKGEIYNYRGNKLCGDCNLLFILFERRHPDALPEAKRLRAKIKPPVDLQQLTKK